MVCDNNRRRISRFRKKCPQRWNRCVSRSGTGLGHGGGEREPDDLPNIRKNHVISILRRPGRVGTKPGVMYRRTRVRKMVVGVRTAGVVIVF